MVPSTWLAVVLFVLVVAPGLAFELLSEKRRAGVSESAFRETSRVVLASLVFGTIAVAILALLRAWHPAWMPDPGQVFKATPGYDSTHSRLIVRTLLIEAGIAFVLVWLTHCILVAISRGASIRPISAWTRTMRHEVPEGSEPAAWVRMNDGHEWMGLVFAFSADLETSGRELVLGQPLYSNGGAGFARVDSSWQRVVLDGGSVQSLTVQYWDKQPDDPTRRPPGPGRKVWNFLCGRPQAAGHRQTAPRAQEGT